MSMNGGKKSGFGHCLYALSGYNGMAFTPWVTLQGENSRRTSPIPPRVTTPAKMRQHNRTWGGRIRTELDNFLRQACEASCFHIVIPEESHDSLVI
ncbi:hypothetical protein AVEN_261467-1, partial [Araneus ventricosus]